MWVRYTGHDLSSYHLPDNSGLAKRILIAGIVQELLLCPNLILNQCVVLQKLCFTWAKHTFYAKLRIYYYSNWNLNSQNEEILSIQLKLFFSYFLVSIPFSLVLCLPFYLLHTRSTASIWESVTVSYHHHRSYAWRSIMDGAGLSAHTGSTCSDF